MIIAIDGPAGAGKSTVSAILAEKLGFHYIRTGNYYRWITHKAIEKAVPLDDPEAIVVFAKTLDFSRMADDLHFLHLHTISKTVPIVAAIKEVREMVAAEQQRVAQSGDVIMEGRDIGTVVFPHADVKFYLTASPQKRAERRAKELAEAGRPVPLDEILQSIIERDTADMTRKHSPLKKAADAIEIDASDLTVAEVVERMLAVVSEKNK